MIKKLRAYQADDMALVLTSSHYAHLWTTATSTSPVLRRLRNHAHAAGTYERLPRLLFRPLIAAIPLMHSHSLRTLPSFSVPLPRSQVRTLALVGTVWGVGPRAARRFYSAGHRSLRQLPFLLFAPCPPPLQVRTLALFGTVWGVGPRTARRFYSAGHRSLRQLAADPGLTPTQRIALRFHEDMNKRIPRDEVAAMAALVVKEGEALQPGVGRGYFG
ncbi:unnamed protein product [Closterium sp. NIES-53]